MLCSHCVFYSSFCCIHLGQCIYPHNAKLCMHLHPVGFNGVFPLLQKKRLLKIIGNILCITISLVFSVLSVSNKTANYTRKSMSDAYISLCDYLEENYVMSEWKNIDYEKLKADGLALISEAEKKETLTNTMRHFISSLIPFTTVT